MLHSIAKKTNKNGEERKGSQKRSMAESVVRFLKEMVGSSYIVLPFWGLKSDLSEASSRVNDLTTVLRLSEREF